MSKLGQISHFPSPVSLVLLLLQGLRWEWGVLDLVLSLSHSLILVTGSSTWHLMAKNTEDLKERIVVPHKGGLGCKKITSTLKLSCSTVAKTIQWFNRKGSTRNRPRHVWLKKCTCSASYLDVVFGKYKYECCQHCCRGWRGGRSWDQDKHIWFRWCQASVAATRACERSRAERAKYSRSAERVLIQRPERWFHFAPVPFRYRSPRV